MIDYDFSEFPDAYVKFKWKGQLMEGEFFQDSWEFDDGKTPKGYIRPSDKHLRQSIIDVHQEFNEIDFYDLFQVCDLVECDALITHTGLQKGYLNVLVTNCEFIEEKDLTGNRELISHCRTDMLRRQYIVAKSVNEPTLVLDRLLQEFKKWVTPDYEPLRYKRTKFVKFKKNGFVKFLGIILLFYILAVIGKR